MGFVPKMKYLRWLIVLAGLTMPLRAQDYCSLTVEVSDPVGKLLSGIPVTVQEREQTVSRNTIEGIAEFCDLGVLGVTVSLGYPSWCNFTEIRNVPLAWQVGRRVKIVYDRITCNRDTITIPVCPVLLRFRDMDGSWIAGVSFAPSVRRSESARSDARGRVMVGLNGGEEIHTRTEKEGYHSQPVDLVCSNSSSEKERTITLEKLH
jgi:hypothetical protein